MDLHLVPPEHCYIISPGVPPAPLVRLVQIFLGVGCWRGTSLPGVKGDVSPFYPMAKTQFVQKRVCRNMPFPQGSIDVSYRSWDKSKIPRPSRNCTFPNLVHHHNLERTPCVSTCFPGPDDASRWVISTWVLAILSMTKTQFMQERVCGNVSFQHDCSVSYRFLTFFSQVMG